MMTREPGHFVDANDGTRIYVKDVGEGDSVLLIPGLGAATWSFNDQIEHLSGSARVLAMDNRGSGRSDKPNGPYSIEQLAEDAFTVLDQCGVAPAHVVGTSMGGYVAQTLALRHPEAVRSLTLIATAAGGPGSHGLPVETLQAWTSAAHLSPADYARATMPYSFALHWVENHPQEFERLLGLRLTALTPVHAWRAQLGACARFLVMGAPKGTITAPTHIVHGTADRVVPYDNASLLAQRIPHARTTTLAGAGHLCWIERPGAVNDVLSEVINRPNPRIYLKAENLVS